MQSSIAMIGSQRSFLRDLKRSNNVDIPSLRTALRDTVSKHEWETLSNGILINVNGEDIPMRLNREKKVRPGRTAISRHFSSSNNPIQTSQDKNARNAQSSSTTMSQKSLDEVISIITPQIQGLIENYQEHLVSQKEMLEVRRLKELDIQPHESALLKVSGEGLFAKRDIKFGTVIDGFGGTLIPSNSENSDLLYFTGSTYSHQVSMIDKDNKIDQRGTAFLIGHSPIKKANACFTKDGDVDNHRNNLEKFYAPVQAPRNKVNSPLRSPNDSPGIETDSSQHDDFSSGVTEIELPFFVANRDIAEGEQLAYHYGSPERFADDNRRLLEHLQPSQETASTRGQRMRASASRASSDTSPPKVAVCI